MEQTGGQYEAITPLSTKGVSGRDRNEFGIGGAVSEFVRGWYT